MSLTASDFRSLLDRLRGGSDEAVTELVNRFGPHILRVVRRQLRTSLRSKFDSQDFTQAVWGSFFENRRELTEFKTPQDLIRFLRVVASRKVLQEFRRHCGTAKNNLEREEEFVNTSDEGDTRLPISRQPSPSRVFAAREEWERLNQNQPSQYRRMLTLRGEGANYSEIAKKLHLDEKTVRRVLKRFSERPRK